MTLTVKDFANRINEECEDFKYFFAYGLVKETIDLWKNEANRNLLCDDAKLMVSQILEK